MRKILILICCLMLVVCLAACGETQEATTETTTPTHDNTEAIQLDEELIFYINAAKTKVDAVQDAIATYGYGSNEAISLAGEGFEETGTNKKIVDEIFDKDALKLYSFYVGRLLFQYYVMFDYIHLVNMAEYYGGVDNLLAQFPDHQASMEYTLRQGIDESFLRELENYCLNEREAFLKSSIHGNLDNADYEKYIAENPFPVCGEITVK